MVDCLCLVPVMLTAGTASRVLTVFLDVDVGVGLGFGCGCCTNVALLQDGVGLGRGDETVSTGRGDADGRGGRQDVRASWALGIFPEPQLVGRVPLLPEDRGSFSANSFDMGEADGDRDGDSNDCLCDDGGDWFGGATDDSLTGDSSGVGGENINADGDWEGGKGGTGVRQVVESDSHASPSSPDHEDWANVDPREV